MKERLKYIFDTEKMSSRIEVLRETIQSNDLYSLIKDGPHDLSFTEGHLLLEEAARFDAIDCFRHLHREGYHVDPITCLICIHHRSIDCFRFFLRETTADMTSSALYKLILNDWKQGFKEVLRYRARDMTGVVNMCIKAGNLYMLKMAFRYSLHLRESEKYIDCSRFLQQKSIQCLKFALRKGLHYDHYLLRALSKHIYYFNLETDVWWRMWIYKHEDSLRHQGHLKLIELIQETRQEIQERTLAIGHALQPFVAEDLIRYIVSEYV